MDELKFKSLKIWIEKQTLTDLIVKIRSPEFYLGVYEYTHYTGDRSFIVGFGQTENEMMKDINEKYNELYSVQKYPPLEVIVYKISNEEYKTALESYIQDIQHKIDVSRDYCVIFKYDSNICGIGKNFDDALRMAEGRFPEISFPQNAESYSDYKSANIGDLCIVSDVNWNSYNKLISKDLQEYKVRRSESSDSGYPYDDLMVDILN